MKSKFIRNIILLAGGTASAQLLNILCLPLLTRLYEPSEFGLYSVLVAINTILTVLCTFKYENAIISTQKELRSRALVQVLMRLVFANAMLLLLISFVIFYFIKFDTEHMCSILVSSFLSVLFGSWFQVLYFWNNRHGKYKAMARSRIIAVLTMLLFSVSYGYLYGDVTGLLFGNAISFIVNFLYLVIHGAKFSIGNNYHIRTRYSFNLLKHFVNFPKYLIASSMLDRISSQAHLFMFSHYYGMAVSGAIGLHTRVISLPTSVICNAVGDVFKRQASYDLSTHGNCYFLFIKTAFSLFLLGSPIALSLFLFSPEIFALIFGETWRSAGEVSQVLSLSFWAAFIVSPLSNLIYLENNQRYDFYLQVFLIVLLIGSVTYCIYFLDMKSAIWAFAVSYVIKYVIEFAICFKISMGNKFLRSTIINKRTR